MIDCPTCQRPFGLEERLDLPEFNFRRGFVLTERGIIKMSAHLTMFMSMLHEAAPETVTRSALMWGIWGSTVGGGGRGSLNHLVWHARQKFKGDAITIHNHQGSDFGWQMGPEYDSAYWLTW